MGTISLKSLTLVQGDTLFSNLTLSLSDGDRVGLVAANGAGKTTLLRIIAGEREPSEGDVTRSRGLRIGFVGQDAPDHLLALTLREAVMDGLPPELRETEGWRADVALDGFEAPDDLRDRKVSALSGGWRRQMLIARTWVDDPDALLMDEPTNHLDLGRILKLEGWLNTVARGIPVIIASHDRAFLDVVTNRTLFLRPGASRYFPLAYSAARQALDEMDAAQLDQAERELKEARKLRKQAAKLTNIGINSGSDLLTVKAKQLKDRAARIEETVQEGHRERSGEIRLANRAATARVLVALENVTVKTPPGEPLFRIDKLHIFQGDRIVLLGRNGTGKTQLIGMLRRALAGEAIAGVRATPSLVLGYADQELADLPLDGTPADVIGVRYKQPDARVRSLLAGAGIPVDRQDKRIGTLSPGQRARLGLLALRLAEPSFYLLDEPTNHLDIVGREALEAELLTPEASGVLVSHDRSFIRTVGTRYLLIDKRRLVETDGPEPFFAALVD